MFWLSHLERKSSPLASFKVFLWRLGRNFVATLGVVGFSLTLGTLGYHYLGHVGWVDGFLNAAMILTGMGPVDRMETTPGKLFAAFYALYSGLAFLTMVAVLITPIYHRFIHTFNLEIEPTTSNDDHPVVVASAPAVSSMPPAPSSPGSV
jgi:hypothetical protein